MSEPLEFDWSGYRKRRRYFVAAIALTLIGMFGLDFLENLGVSKIITTIVFFAWGAVIVFPSALRYGKAPCPRCSKPIHFKNGFGYPFGPKCLHCGLKTGSTGER